VNDVEVSGLSLQVLISVSDDARHGYAIGQDIEERTGQRPGPGSLYGAISRLESLGLIEGLDDAPRRRRYRLSDSGQALLADVLTELATTVAVGQRRLKVAWA
jgi:DNA-binding PadR family transcriptional regulator